MGLTDLIPPQAKIALLALAILGAGMAGWVVRGWKEDAGRLDADRAAAQKYRETVEAHQAALQAVGQFVAAQQQQAAGDRETFKKELKHAQRNNTPLAVCGTGLAPAGSPGAGRDVRFTADFVRLWNNGLAIGLPAPLRPGRSDSRSPAADPAPGR